MDRIDTGNPEQWVIRFINAAGYKELVAWNALPTTATNYNHPSATDRTVYSVLGDRSTVFTNGTTIPLSLSIHPIYVRPPERP